MYGRGSEDRASQSGISVQPLSVTLCSVGKISGCSSQAVDVIWPKPGSHSTY